MSLSLTFSEPGARPWRNFTPPRPRRGSFQVFHRDQRDLLCCSSPISSDEQTRNHDDLLLRRFASGGKLGFFRCHHEHNRRKLGLEGLRGFCFFALAAVGQSTSEALFVPATPSFPHRYRSLLLLLSVLACSEESATAGYVAELQRSQFLCRSAR